MTLAQAKKLYIAAGGPSDHGDSEWKDIHKEMEAVCAANTDRAAAKVIAWWGCWDGKHTATAFARTVRGLHANSNRKAERAAALAKVVWNAAKSHGLLFEDVIGCCSILVSSVAHNSGEPVEYLLDELKRRMPRPKLTSAGPEGV